MIAAGAIPPADQVVDIIAQVADGLHFAHQQDIVHRDVKPSNIMVLKNNALAKITDFGIARLPNSAVKTMTGLILGSPRYMSPEQVIGKAIDSRSDIFSLGVVLYEMATGELPFGVPETMAGLSDRLWRDPAPPRSLEAAISPWLQEIILRCLEPRAEDRYQSAAHVAFDLRTPEQVALTARAARSGRATILAQARRWWRVRREQSQLAPAPTAQAPAAPVILVAVDTMHPEDARQPVLRRAALQMLALSAEFRLICVSVVRAGPVSAGENGAAGASGIHLEHLVRLRHWVEPLHLPPQRLSMHVIESPRPESALLDFARRNNVDLIVLGAPSPAQHALAWWRSVASSVTANAPCSVYVVRIPEPEAISAPAAAESAP
jgi:nucleotide-binding universal stress UspA family protein